MNVDGFFKKIKTNLKLFDLVLLSKRFQIQQYDF